MAKKDAKALLNAAEDETYSGTELILLAFKEMAAQSTGPASSSHQSSFASCCPSSSVVSCERIIMLAREGGHPRGAAHTRGVNNTRGSKTRGAKRGRGEGRGTGGGRGGGGARRGADITYGGKHRGDVPRKGSNGWLTTDDISGSHGPSTGGSRRGGASRSGASMGAEPPVNAVNEPAKIKEKHPNGQPYIKISQIASVYGLPALGIPLDCFRRVGVSIYAFEASRVTPEQLRAARRRHEMDGAIEPEDLSGSDGEVGA